MNNLRPFSSILGQVYCLSAFVSGFVLSRLENANRCEIEILSSKQTYLLRGNVANWKLDRLRQTLTYFEPGGAKFSSAYLPTLLRLFP